MQGRIETTQPNEPLPKPKKMRLKRTKSKRPPEQGRQHTRVRSVTPRRADRGGPRTRTRNLSPSHRISGLALLLFLITTVTPSVEGSTFRSSPETPFYEYAQSGQKEADNQELGTANAPSTEQILLISSAIALTIWHLTRTRDDVPRVELSIKRDTQHIGR
jgi:hypothetical protein